MENQKRMNPSESSFTHPAALEQIGRASELNRRLGGELRLTGSHASKSIPLPVQAIELPGVRFTFRDNFHDINLLVEADREVRLPLSFFYKPMTFADYMAAVKSKRNYSYQHWTDEEMADPRILRVPHPKGSWSEVCGAEKDRWTARMSDTSWYVRDWSGGSITAVGPVPFTEETVFYHAQTAHAQGIQSSALPYMEHSKIFMNCLRDWDELVRVCLGIVEHLKSEA